MALPLSGHQEAAPVCRGRKSPLGYLSCVLLTGALLDRAVAGQVMHDAVVDLRVKPHGRGCHVLQR